MRFDTKIVGGTLVDGTGAPAYRGDIGIANGRIAAIGKADGPAREVVDAGGLAVTPGFIDIHTHYDAQILWDRCLSISPWHGVTTVVMGNCGFTLAPTRRSHRDLILMTLEKVEGMSLDALNAGLGDAWPCETFPGYLDAVAARGTAINVAALIGHTAVRLYVMGEDALERKATGSEIAEMRRVVLEGLRAGAVGFSTSAAPSHVGYRGQPVPSRLADFDEIRQIAGALTEAGHGIFQATIGPGLQQEQFAQLQREIRRPVTWTALLAGYFGRETHREQLQRALATRAEGLDVVPQVSCRPLNFEFTFEEPFPFESFKVFKPVSQADGAGKRRLYRDPEFRRQIKERFGPAAAPSGLTAWEQRAVVAHSPLEPGLDERPLADIARERGVDAVDLGLDLALAADLRMRFRVPIHNVDEDEVERLLKAPGTIVALSDAGAHASQLCDACYSTHLLGHWVRERGTFTLEEGVHKLTGQPANLLGLNDRGRLSVGQAADVVLLDPKRVGAGPLRRVADLPAGADRLVSDATGIERVWVNGVTIRQNNRDAVGNGGAWPGRLLRAGR